MSYLIIKPNLPEANHFGGDEEAWTPDPLRARQVLSQLSYAPVKVLSVLVICFQQKSFI